MKIILHDSCQNHAREKIIQTLGDNVITSTEKVISLQKTLSESELRALKARFDSIESYSQSDLPLVAQAKAWFWPGFTVIAGPCAIESSQQIFTTAKVVADSGAKILRGGAFKPRTSVYDFQGLGLPGLKIMSEAAKQNNLLVISEVLSLSDIELMSDYVDIFQVGARNMQNFALLRELGRQKHPVMLKRAASATYYEFLAAAEYILASGNNQVILCERGVKSFEPSVRNTLDLSIVPMLKQQTDLPIFIDPSHAIGVRAAVPALAMAAAAVGADGLMLEVHPSPDHSVSDAKQALSFSSYKSLMLKLDKIIKSLA